MVWRVVRDQWGGYTQASVRTAGVSVGFAVVVIDDGGVVLAAKSPIGNWIAGRAFGLLSAQDSYKNIKNTG